MSKVKIVALAGSLRNKSFNHSVIEYAAKMAKELDAEVDLVSLAELDLPMFDEDVEAQGVPAGAATLKDKLRSADAILLASPEYNGSITAVLKNAIDWASRTESGAQPAFNNKVVALFAASPGGLGGLRGLNHVRDILSGIGALVLGQQLAIPAVHSLLDEQGQVVDEKTQQSIKGLTAQLVQVAGKLK